MSRAASMIRRCEEAKRMSGRAGREFLAIPGPTTVPDEVLRAMHRPAVDIYSGPLVQLTDSLTVPNPGAPVLLHRQWAWRMGSGVDQRALEGRQDPGVGKRPVRGGLGRCCGWAWRRRRGAQGGLAPRSTSGRGRG